MGNAVTGRRRLATGLRKHRLEAGLTIVDLARLLECSPAKISRMETGTVGIRLPDLQAIADLLSLGDEARAGMVALVREARSRGWWQEFSDVVPPGSATFYGLEDGASTIYQYTSSLVPGLLQTRHYAAALIGSVAGTDPEVLDRRLALRMRRKQVLQRPAPPELRVLLDEAVVHRVVADARIMAEQLDHLLSVLSRPSLDVRIVPFSAGAHPAAGTTFSVFDFDDPGVTPVAFTEHLTSNGFAEDLDDVRVFQEAFDSAEGVALDADSSRRLLQRKRDGLR